MLQQEKVAHRSAPLVRIQIFQRLANTPAKPLVRLISRAFLLRFYRKLLDSWYASQGTLLFYWTEENAARIEFKPIQLYGAGLINVDTREVAGSPVDGAI
jgi:hypothetical protein